MCRLSLFLLCLWLLASCSDRRSIEDAVNKWEGKTILFPDSAEFTSLGRSKYFLSEKEWDYAIATYADSVGCTGCKLQLPKWKEFIQITDSFSEKEICFLFFIHPAEYKETVLLLNSSQFDYPVCIDTKDEFNQMNHLNENPSYQTFLIDKNHKVIGIGNPIFNPQIKNMYLKIIQGKSLNNTETDKTPQTTVSIPSTEISMGDFPWQEEQTAVFTLKNTGDKPLVIQDAATSCGCLHVSFTQQPVLPGDEAEVHATYKADNPGYFNKSITVYTNAGDAPMKLRVRGNAMK